MTAVVIMTACSRCGGRIWVMNTNRGRRIAVNPEPLGHEAFRFRKIGRLEEYYVPREHQPHVATCPRRDDPEPVVGRDKRRRHV